MPKKAIDYSKALIYKLVCKDPTIPDLYVGSTTNKKQRKSQHKHHCNNESSVNYNFYVYQVIRDHGGWDNWEMILIEYYPCHSELELLQRERYWREHLNATLNTIQNMGLLKELGQVNYSKHYYDSNKKQIRIKQKVKYETHKSTIIAQQGKYYCKNKAKVLLHAGTKHKCECGCDYTQANKSRHMKTAKHQDYENNKMYFQIRKGLNMIKALDKHFNI